MKTEVFKKEIIILISTLLLVVLIVYAANNLPAIGSVVLNSTAPANNNTIQNLTCWNISVTDADGEPVKTIFNWYKDEEMLEFLNIPFEGNTTKRKGYSDHKYYCSEGQILHFETFERDLIDSAGDPWTVKEGSWSEGVRDPNIKKFGFYSVNTTDNDGGDGSIYLTKLYNVKTNPNNALDNTTEAYLDIWYKCEVGARWNILASNGSWNCITGNGNTSCGADYHHIGNLTPTVVCDDTWRNTEFNLSKEFPGKTIIDMIIGDYDSVNTSNQNKVMWFDNFQIYNTSRVPVWNSTGGYDGFGAYEFDGIDKSITCGYSPIADDNNCSLSAWVKTSSSNAFIFGAYVTFPTKLGFGLSLTNGNITIHGDLANGKSIQINDSKWHHVVGTYEKHGVFPFCRIYVDGVERNSGNLAGPEPVNLYITIGANVPIATYSNFLNGTIDDLRIYNHTLSAEQVALLYESKSWVIHSEETILAEDWKCSVTPFDGTESGTTVNSSTVTILNSAPVVYLRSPLNNTNSTTKQTEFIYNVTDADGNEIDNCTLWIKNSTGLTIADVNTSITIDQNVSVSLNLDYEEINWLVSCEDSSSSEENSSTWIYTVIQPPTGPTGGPSHSSRSYYLPEPEKEPEEKEIEKEVSKEEKETKKTTEEKLPEKENKLKKYIPPVLAASIISLFVIFNWKIIIKVLLKK